MKNNLLAQAINFPTLMQQALPTYTPGKINLKDIDLNLGTIISAILPYIFVIAGLILFFLLISSGFELLTSGGNPETQKKAQAKLTSAFVGFIIIFLAYWLAQIVEAVLGITIF